MHGVNADAAAQTSSEDAWSGLMAQAQAGDQAAYHQLLTEIAPWLRRVAWRALRRADDAEDATQDCLLTVHAARHSYDPARPIKPWLFAIARARIADRQRALMRHANRETSLDAEIERHGETFAAPATNSGMGIDARSLRRAMASLPSGQRQAIGLLKLREMSLQEAAAFSGQSVGALKVAVHRGLARLRQIMAAAE